MGGGIGCGRSALPRKCRTVSSLQFLPTANCNDGFQPLTGLLLATNGNFYGTTERGGTGSGSGCPTLGCGTIFRVMPRSRLAGFTAFACKRTVKAGSTTSGSLIQATDGNFYGLTTYGGKFTNVHCIGGAHK